MDLSTEILIMLFLMMLSIMGGHFLKKRGHKYLQESGLTTLIGVAAGLMLKSMDITEYTTNLSNHFVRLFMPHAGHASLSRTLTVSSLDLSLPESQTRTGLFNGLRSTQIFSDVEMPAHWCRIHWHGFTRADAGQQL